MLELFGRGSEDSATRVVVRLLAALAVTCAAQLALLPSVRAEVIACNESELPFGGICRFCVPGECDQTVCQDVLCDASCGAECVYDFFPALVLEGRLRSNGPVIRFTGGNGRLVFERGVEPAVETPPGGSVTIDVGTIELRRSVTAESGTIDVTVDSLIEGFGRASFDASGEQGGGIVRIRRSPVALGLDAGFLRNTDLKAVGRGPGAPGGRVVIEPGPYLVINGGRIVMDASGASGGSISLPAVATSASRRLSLRARGRESDGGTVTIDGSLSDDPAHQAIDLRGCRGSGFLAGPGADIRVDGRRNGGTFAATGRNFAVVCARVRAAGVEAGGTILVRDLEGGPSFFDGRAWLLRGDVRGLHGPGGTIRLEAVSSIAAGRMLTGGMPGGSYTALITGP